VRTRIDALEEEPPVSDPIPDRTQGRAGAARRGLFLRTAAVALASAAVGGGIVAAVDRPGAAPTAAAATSASAASSAASAPTSLPTASSTGPQSMREIYAERSAGIVEVRATSGTARSNGFGYPQSSSSQGSGVVIDDAGHILTNAHVIDGQSAVTVAFADGSTAKARVVGRDNSTDLALLDVDVAASKLDPVPLGSSAALHVGDWVMAIGDPFGYDRSASAGIVSGLNRQIQALNGFTIAGAIQTDAAINHGSSGGALLDDHGRLIGITAQIADSGVDGNVGIGFAIPVDTAKRVAGQLEQGGKVAHAWLGISGSDAAQLAAQTGSGPDRGAVVTGVVTGSPAAKAGLKAGTGARSGTGAPSCAGADVITAVDGRQISGMADLQQAISASAPGATLTLTVMGADGNSRQVQVTLAAQPSSAPEPQTGC
jgi:S1-C subfamily serine protease